MGSGSEERVLTAAQRFNESSCRCKESSKRLFSVNLSFFINRSTNIGIRYYCASGFFFFFLIGPVGRLCFWSDVYAVLSNTRDSTGDWPHGGRIDRSSN